MLTRRQDFSVAALFLVTSCATHRETGAALVGTGLVVAVVTAEAATGGFATPKGYANAATEQRFNTPGGYSQSTCRHGAKVAAGVGVGVALAAAGAAIAKEGPEDAWPAARGSANPSPRGGWRLVRPAENAKSSNDPDPSP
jgi:hypothetical protein